MQQVPRLVAEPLAGGLDARDDDHDQRDGAAEGEQHARVGDGEVPERRGRRGDAAGGVPPGDQDDVRQHQAERREPDDPVLAREPVLAEGALERRQPGHQQHLHQQQVGRDQAGEPAQRGEPGRPADEVADAARSRPPVRHQQQAQPEACARGEAHGGVDAGPAERGAAGDPLPRPGDGCGGHSVLPDSFSVPPPSSSEPGGVPKPSSSSSCLGGGSCPSAPGKPPPGPPGNRSPTSPNRS